ncbi:MAG TPA: alpha/beta hydrolase [Gallionella sp.]
MKPSMQLFLILLALGWLTPSWCDDTPLGTVEECIDEPVFEGKVCTLQANRDAGIGVILIHGLDGSVADWEHIIPALAKDFHVVAFDLPGFGKSDKGSQEYNPTRYARLAQFLANHYFQEKPFHIAGHSMGGAIALRFASQQPMRFRRLVLIDAAGILHPLVMTKFQAGSMLQNKSGVAQSRGFAERLSGRILEKVDGLPISPNDIVNTALGRDLVLQGGPSYIAAMGLAEENFAYAVSSVTAPTLVLWGDHDMIAPLRTGRVLAGNLPHARLEVITGSGHEPMREQPEQVNARLREHLLDSDEQVAERFMSKPLPAALASSRVAKCSGEKGKVYKGDYLAIELRDCTNVTVRDARIGRLSALNSQLNLTDTDILGKEVGLQADNSDITYTNGRISGEVAIQTTASRLDLAGVHLTGSRASIQATDSKLTCSICRVSSPLATGNLHAFKNIVNEKL